MFLAIVLSFFLTGAAAEPKDRKGPTEEVDQAEAIRLSQELEKRPSVTHGLVWNDIRALVKTQS